MNYITGVIFIAFLQASSDSPVNLKIIEEDTFAFLTVIMEDYGLSDLYANGFEKL